MQVSKFLLTVCATAVCAGIISVHAQDNPAQAAARAALMEQMYGTQTPPPTQPSSPAPAQEHPLILSDPQPATTVQGTSITEADVLNAAAEAQKQADVAAQAGAAAQQAEAAAASADAEALKLKEAAAQASAAAQAKAQTAAQLKVEAQKQAEAKKQAILAEQKSADDEAAAQAKIEAKRAAQAKEQAALAEKQQTVDEVNAQQAADAQAKAKAAEEKAAASAADASRVPGLQPMQAPALPISLTKEQQLQMLNAKYVANQISPEEYFKQRAIILAEP